MDARNNRVVVAMSGGVDSSVAAALLTQKGWDVVGVTLQLKDCDETSAGRSCCSIDAIARAKRVAENIGIPHYTLCLKKEFGEQVLRSAWEEYSKGRTPSPCLLCNQKIKFGILLNWAKKIDADSIATGHYARTGIDSNGQPYLLRGVDCMKDQSYFLSRLSPAQLQHVIFPLGAWEKKDTRRFARDIALPVAEQKESQDACLVTGQESFSEMLRRRWNSRALAGTVKDEDGKVLGRHDGIHRFTIGQRRNIGIGDGTKRWVMKIDHTSSTIFVTSDECRLFTTTMNVSGICWHFRPDVWPFACQVQVRYRHAPAAATCRECTDGSLQVQYALPQRALTPGQAAVFYSGERVIASGWIDSEGICT